MRTQMGPGTLRINTKGKWAMLIELGSQANLAGYALPHYSTANKNLSLAFVDTEMRMGCCVTLFSIPVFLSHSHTPLCLLAHSLLPSPSTPSSYIPSFSPPQPNSCVIASFFFLLFIVTVFQSAPLVFLFTFFLLPLLLAA